MPFDNNIVHFQEKRERIKAQEHGVDADAASNSVYYLELSAIMFPARTLCQFYTLINNDNNIMNDTKITKTWKCMEYTSCIILLIFFKFTVKITAFYSNKYEKKICSGVDQKCTHQVNPVFLEHLWHTNRYNDVNPVSNYVVQRNDDYSHFKFPVVLPDCWIRVRNIQRMSSANHYDPL